MEILEKTIIMGLIPDLGNIAKSIGKMMILFIMVIYVISPIDLLPEAVLGPIGLIDDALVILFGSSFLGFNIFRKMKITRQVLKR